MKLEIYPFLILVGMAGMRLMVPVLFAALGEIITERSGVFNLSIEGVMLIGAFVMYLGTEYFNNMLFGAAFTLLAGLMIGSILAFFYVTLRANQAAVGLSFWFLLIGITSYLHRLIFGVLLVPIPITPLSPINIPILQEIPLIGPIVFNQNIMVYAAIIITVIVGIILTKTTMGLKIKSAGINPLAVQAQGINVRRLRFLSVMFGTMMIALGGGYMAIELGVFDDRMIAGRGWMAIGVTVFSGWSAYKALGGAFLFGVVDALQIQLQVLFPGWPYQILMMLPFIVTIVVLALTSRKVVYPSALGIPF